MSPPDAPAGSHPPAQADPSGPGPGPQAPPGAAPGSGLATPPESPAESSPAAEERVVLVDEHDRPIGTCEKIAAHRGGGRLHRAFSVFVLDPAGRVLLQRRADTKYHFGGLWTNTCCGHPREGEAVLDAGRRRLEEEMGLRLGLSHAGTFTYQARDEASGLTEREIDHVLIGRGAGPAELTPALNPDEASEARWVTLDELERELAETPERFTPWFPLAWAEASALLRASEG